MRPYWKEGIIDTATGAPLKTVVIYSARECQNITKNGQ